MAQNWKLDPSTGDYVIENGRPVETDSLTTPAYIRLKTPRNRWLYAPDDKYGSTFYTSSKRQSSQDPSNLERIAEVALQPILEDGRAVEVTINTESASRNNVIMSTTLQQESGDLETLILPKLGA